jgi:hypothetical protein
MAFDNRRLRSFKWLEDLANKRGKFPIMVYCDSIYATDEIILAKVDYPEFVGLTDYEWCKVVSYIDNDGFLKNMPDLELMERQFRSNSIFNDMFIKKQERFDIRFDPKVFKRALKIFEINKIMPSLSTDNSRIELTGHNNDVSIRVLMMGVGSK